MQRVSKDQYYLDIAKSVTERSTCMRRNYGAIIVKDDEVISTGYNGAPRGEANCCGCGYCQREAMGIPKGERYELCVAVHAEANAIISAARRDMIGATIYIVGIEAKDGSFANPAPCMMCRRLIKNAGIVRCVGLIDGIPVEIPLDPPASAAPAAKKEEYVNGLLKGGYIAVPVYASYSLLAHAGKAEAENNPTVVLGVKQDYMEAYAKDRHYPSLEAFMENYTLDVTEDLEDGAALQKALAFVYIGDILPNQTFSYLRLAEPDAVKAYLDFKSKLLDSQGSTEVAKELAKLADGIGRN